MTGRAPGIRRHNARPATQATPAQYDTLSLKIDFSAGVRWPFRHHHYRLVFSSIASSKWVLGPMVPQQLSWRSYTSSVSVREKYWITLETVFRIDTDYAEEAEEGRNNKGIISSHHWHLTFKQSIIRSFLCTVSTKNNTIVAQIFHILVKESPVLETIA